MQTITTIGLDIAKSVFQVHGVDAEGNVVIRRQLRRRYVLASGSAATAAARPLRRPRVRNERKILPCRALPGASERARAYILRRIQDNQSLMVGFLASSRLRPPTHVIVKETWKYRRAERPRLRSVMRPLEAGRNETLWTGPRHPKHGTRSPIAA